MPSEIVKYDVTDISDTLTNAVTTGFELTSYADDTTLSLASGRAEEIGGATYRVENGSFAITDSASDGVAYVYVEEDGGNPGYGKATLSSTAPTYSATNGGYYNGTAKAIFKLDKSGSDYSNKFRLLKNQGKTYHNQITVENLLVTEVQYGSNVITSVGSYDVNSFTLEPGAYSVSFSVTFDVQVTSGSVTSHDYAVRLGLSTASATIPGGSFDKETYFDKLNGPTHLCKNSHYYGRTFFLTVSSTTTYYLVADTTLSTNVDTVTTRPGKVIIEKR